MAVGVQVKHPTVSEIVDFRMRMKALSDDPANDKSMLAIVATRAAIDLDHIARLISSPSIQLEPMWVQVKAKNPTDARKLKMILAKQRKDRARRSRR